MKKIAVLALVLVLCLAAVGIGYAKWTDSLTINGTVTTAEFGVQFVDASGTWVYKDVDMGTMVIQRGWGQTDPQGIPELEDWVLYASGQVEISQDLKTADVVWWNLFPTCEPICADVVWQYYGTIPGVVDNTTFTWDGDEEVADLLVSYQMVRCTKTDTGWDISDIAVGKDTQLEPGDYVYAEACFQLEEESQYIGLDASGTFTINVSQWADCPTPTVEE